MGLFELVILLLLVGAVLSMWANRMGIPYPAMLALAGAALTFIPGTPQVVLDPGLALALFVSPVLLDAAYDASPRDLIRNIVTVSSLAIVAVGVTVVAVAFVARHYVPGMSWAAAIALGLSWLPPTRPPRRRCYARCAHLTDSSSFCKAKVSSTTPARCSSIGSPSRRR